MEHIIAAGDFKAKCLQMLDEVAEQRGSLWVFTDHQTGKAGGQADTGAARTAFIWRDGWQCVE